MATSKLASRLALAAATALLVLLGLWRALGERSSSTDPQARSKAEAASATADAALQLAANVTVTDPPFADESILGHIDTTGPALLIEEGHLDNADFGIEVPWALAKQLFIDRDPTQVMPALFGGAIKLTGDSSKILALASILAPPSGGDPGDTTAPDVVRELIERVDAITEP